MAISAADTTLLETHPHTVKFYLVVHQPETALAAQVNGDVSGDPVTTITFDNVSLGAWGDIEAGQTLLIGSVAGGHDRGIVRVRSATSTVLTIAESSDLRPVEDDDYLTVLREHRFWTKLPRIVSQTETYEDYDVSWVSENHQFGPIAMMGPAAFVFLDGATVDIEYDFSNSYPIEGASIDSYASVYQHGDSGTGAASTDTETYSSATGMSGSETKLTVTDDNSQTAVGWRQDFILSRSGADAPIIDFLVTSSVKGSWEGTEPLEFLLYGDAYQTTIRDGSHVWLIYESWYGDTNKEISLEYPDRANILFEGWVDGDSITREADHSVVRFSANPLTKMLDEGKAYPATLELAATPVTWYQVTSCSTIKAALYICKWRSTLSEITDINIPTTFTSTSGEDWPSGSIKSQLAQALAADLMVAAQHKSGMLYFEKHASLMSAAERAALDLAIILGPEHWQAPLEVPVQATPDANYVLFEGVYFDGADGFPFFSEAPGLAAKYRGQDGGKIDRLAVDDQDHINQICGDVLAMKNAAYPKVPVQLTGFWPVLDCVPQRRYRIALTSGMNIRGVSISGLNFIPREWQIDVNQPQGIGMTSAAFQEETDGEDGQSVVYQTNPPPIVSLPTPGPYIPPYIPPPYTPTDGGRRILATDIGVVACDNISSPKWYTVNNGFLTAADKQVYDIKRDPLHWWSTGGEERRLWAFTRTGIWYQDNFPAGTWVQQISYAQLLSEFGFADDDPGYCYKGRMGFSIEQDGLYGCAFNIPRNAGAQPRQHQVVIVVADGSIVSSAQIDEWANSGDPNTLGYPDCIALPHSAAQAFLMSTSRVPGHVTESRSELYKTSDQGASWGRIDGPYGWSPGGIYSAVVVPYESAENQDQYYLWGRGGGVAGATGIWRISTDGGTTFTTLNDAASEYSRISEGGFHNRIWLLSYRPDNVASKWSSDIGENWATLPVISEEGTSFAAFDAWDGDTLVDVLLGASPTGVAPGTVRMWYWANGDAAWTNKTSNLEDFGTTEVRMIDRDTMGSA